MHLLFKFNYFLLSKCVCPKINKYLNMNYLLSKKASNPASIAVPALVISLATKCFRSSLDDSAGTTSTSLL